MEKTVPVMCSTAQHKLQSWSNIWEHISKELIAPVCVGQRRMLVQRGTGRNTSSLSLLMTLEFTNKAFITREGRESPDLCVSSESCYTGTPLIIVHRNRSTCDWFPGNDSAVKASLCTHALMVAVIAAYSLTDRRQKFCVLKRSTKEFIIRTWLCFISQYGTGVSCFFPCLIFCV